MTASNDARIGEISADFNIEGSLDDVVIVSGLAQIAERIKERDRCAERYAYAQWLENGRDLLEAKALLKHGDFGEWCHRELSYSARTAQKLMRAAEVFEPYLKNESGSYFPKPAIVYALSAPSVPKDLRDRYVPRVIAGENVGTELRLAIRERRTALKREKEREARLKAKSPKAQKAQVNREEANARREEREAEQSQAERRRQASARTKALSLIREQFGNNLPALMKLAAEAGSGNVFGFEAERELQALANVGGAVEICSEEDSGGCEVIPLSKEPAAFKPSCSESALTVAEAKVPLQSSVQSDTSNQITHHLTTKISELLDQRKLNDEPASTSDYEIRNTVNKIKGVKGENRLPLSSNPPLSSDSSASQARPDGRAGPAR